MIKTIYIGGGTPALLSITELQQLFEQIDQCFSVDADAEVTLEANPDDLTGTYLKELRNTPVNRLSIGVQSFFDDDLNLLNRPHTANQSKNTIKTARAYGFSNLSIDLLFGFPNFTQQKWEQNIRQFIEFKVPHLTCYELTLAPGTKLYQALQSKQIPAPNPDKTAEQYRWLVETLPQSGYEHYEISNFALPGRQAIHTSNYWKEIPCLGIGPSAHSYYFEDTTPVRQWNTDDVQAYLQAIQNKKVPAQRESLTTRQQFHEYLMHHLYTNRGCDLAYISKEFGDTYKQHVQEKMQERSLEPYITEHDGKYYLTIAGKLQADRIISRLFLDK